MRSNLYDASAIANMPGPTRRVRTLLALAAAACLPALVAPAAPAAAQDAVQAVEAVPAAQPGGEDVPLGTATMPPPGRCVPPPPDMDAWYPFEGNGTDLILARNATASGAVTYPNAVVQRGARLTTANSYLTIAPGPVLNQGLGDFSIDFWLFVPRDWLPGPHPVRTLIEKRTNVGGYRGYSVFVYNSRLGLQLADGAHSNYGQPATSQPLTAGWNHVAITVDRDSPQGVVFYRNGVVTATANPTDRQGNLDNGAPTLIGRNAFGHGGPSTNAVFDELEFFDRVLQPGEVQALFGAGRAGKCRRR